MGSAQRKEDKSALMTPHDTNGSTLASRLSPERVRQPVALCQGRSIEFCGSMRIALGDFRRDRHVRLLTQCRFRWHVFGSACKSPFVRVLSISVQFSRRYIRKCLPDSLQYRHEACIRAYITITIRLLYDYDTTIPRRIQLRRKWSKLRFAFDSIAIRLRQDYDKKLTCSFFARVESRRMEAGARDTS